MAYVVFPSINSAKSIFMVIIYGNIICLVFEWKLEFEWERQDLGTILT